MWKNGWNEKDLTDAIQKIYVRRCNRTWDDDLQNNKNLYSSVLVFFFFLRIWDYVKRIRIWERISVFWSLNIGYVTIYVFLLLKLDKHKTLKNGTNCLSSVSKRDAFLEPFLFNWTEAYRIKYRHVSDLSLHSCRGQHARFRTYPLGSVISLKSVFINGHNCSSFDQRSRWHRRS